MSAARNEPAGPESDGTIAPRPAVTRAVAGYLILALILTSVGHGVGAAVPAWIPGACGWLAALLLVRASSLVQRLQAVAMIGIGAAVLAWSTRHAPAAAPLADAISMNQAIMAMIAAVGFVRLVSRSGVHTGEALPVGRRALAQTMLGTTLFGAVINVSAMVIVGDRISRAGTLTRLQALAMSRAFASTALWSPFFAVMVIAVVYSGGARLPVLIAAGVPLALVSLGYTLSELGRAPEAAGFEGYPIHGRALVLPASLAALMLIVHALAPAIAIATLIAMLAPLLTLAIGLVRHGRRFAAMLDAYVRHELPRMGGEIVLFSAAGVLAVGLAHAAQASRLLPPFAAFGPLQAVLVVFSIALSCVAGLHPLVGIAAWSAVLLPLGSQPDLLGVTFLVSGSIGVCVSPFSGLHLFLQGRYGIPSHHFTVWNARYGIVMLAAAVPVLYAVDYATR
ncbi:MAG: hypothetical protein IT495_08015 [Gammaproteobacteria bacterium]|nr:hypothetical protein [Gammaproteobacteria bacterium]